MTDLPHPNGAPPAMPAAQPLMLPTAIPPMPVPTAFATLQLPDGRGGSFAPGETRPADWFRRRQWVGCSRCDLTVGPLRPPSRGPWNAADPLSLLDVLSSGCPWHDAALRRR